ncbi:MAG: ATP-dependent DNA helicase RecQ [Nanoarchaeota archaeon]
MAEQEEILENYEQKLLDLAIKAENGNFDFAHLRPHEILKEVFDHNGFKPQQLEIITRILNREGNTLGIMPTGGGKSVCFQIPALIQENLTVVISPLIALMKDQIDNLTKKGIYTAFFVNSSISDNTKERILDIVEKKKVKLLYLAPESLKSERILEVLKKLDIGLFVIDEAHCISTWGHNFRPDYLRLPEIIDEINHPQVLALTATATKEVEEDIQKQLKTQCKVFKASFDRPNLYIDVISLDKNVKKELFLVNLLKQLEGSSIVFVTYRASSEKISEILNSKGIKSVPYHAGLDREVRENIQNQFVSGESRVIVATIAFGMGIDKANIRNIIHYNIPQSIENYYQEIGRAGRDGNLSNCIVLFTKTDEDKIKDLISSSWPEKNKIENIISYLKNKNSKYFFATTKKICFDCDIKEIPTNLILHRLEESEAIKIFTNIIYQVKPLFNKNYFKIIEENTEYKKDLEKIFYCDFFKNSRRTWLVLEELVDKTGLNYFRILEILNHLRKNGYLKFSEIMRKDLIWIKDKINDFDITPLVNLFDSILNHDLIKVDLLIKSLTKQGCIRKNILEYFNEPHLRDNCEMCSYCVGNKLTEEIKPEINENYATDEEIENLIDLEIYSYKRNLPLTLLLSVAQNREIEEKDFVKILIGNLHKSSSKWKFVLDCYGILDNFKNQEIVLEELLKGLINKELISEEMDGTLRITKKGIKYVSENELVLELPYHKKLENLRLYYPQAYKPWTTEEEKQLTELFGNSKSVSEISKIMCRKAGGIKSRLRKIGLIKD